MLPTLHKIWNGIFTGEIFLTVFLLCILFKVYDISVMTICRHRTGNLYYRTRDCDSGTK